MATSTLLTIDDFERLPAEAAKNHELVDGELVEVSGNTPRHNGLRDRLISLLLPLVTARQLGMIYGEQEYDFLGNAHGPDISFFGAVKRRLVDPDKRVQRFVPDLAIEIVSPSDTYTGMLKKKDRYLQAGTAEVWLISPESSEVRICRPDHDRILHGSDTLATELIPGFSLTVEELLRGI